MTLSTSRRCTGSFATSLQITAPDSPIQIWLDTSMLPKRNLADPNYEPSDEDFRELCLKAFAGLKERRLLADRRLQEEIQRLRKDALARLHAEANSDSPMGH
jgi:hypothetical protein